MHWITSLLGNVNDARVSTVSYSLQLYKNVAERGRWGEMLMKGHMLYRSSQFNEAFVHYCLLSELGYEVAQSNAAFMLDRGEFGCDLFQALRIMKRFSRRLEFIFHSLRKM
ncbi:unnamed protein product, partial [Nesidiocoris tenuis]